MKNPLAIVKRFDIPYGNLGEDLHLEGRIIGHMEEGYDSVNWFSGRLVYPKRGCEVGGQRFDKLHKDLKKGASTIMEVKLKLKRWCDSMGLKIVSEEDMIDGIRYNSSRRLEIMCIA